jgi:hypothetical protein
VLHNREFPRDCFWPSLSLTVAGHQFGFGIIMPLEVAPAAVKRPALGLGEGTEQGPKTPAVFAPNCWRIQVATFMYQRH